MRRARGEEQEATDRLGRQAGAERGAEREALARIAKRREPRRARATAEVAESRGAESGGAGGGLVDGARRLWSSPTRRHFLGLVLAAGAVSVSGEALRSPAEPRHTWNGRTRWIGHC